jgi:hypothetical protein
MRVEVYFKRHQPPPPLFPPPLSSLQMMITTTGIGTDTGMAMEERKKILVAGGLMMWMTNVSVNYWSACHPSFQGLAMNTLSRLMTLAVFRTLVDLRD